jgi:FKBP-type peptidyl-prolyl cis-trans isomerase SlyD
VNITKDCLVTLSYRILDQNGELFEEGYGEDATDYIHGYGELPPGVEEALEGGKVGDSILLNLTVETGFGPVDPELIIGVPRDELGEDTEINKGDILPVQVTDEEGEVNGEVDMIVVEIRADTVFLDANHPLAGQNVTFSAEVLEVRMATEEELDTLHVHGEDCDH